MSLLAITRNLFTSAGVVQQSMRTANESFPLSILRSFSQTLQSYESDHDFIVTEDTEVSGYKIGRVRGQVWGKCSLLTPLDYDARSRTSDICKHNARLDMIESAQLMKANAILGVRYSGQLDGDKVVERCRGDAVVLIKGE